MSRRILKLLSDADPALSAALAGLAAFFVYLRTLAPTVMWYDMGEFATTARVLGIAHNTGYPLYILLGRLFTFLPVGNVAYRVNLMSAVFAALTVTVVYLIVHHLTGSRPAALLGCLTLAFSSTFWSNANWAESYPLNAFSVAIITYLLLCWRQSGRAWQLYLVFLAFGLSLGNHRLIVLLVPGILLFLWSGRRNVNAGQWLRCGLLFLLGLSIYLYLPLRGMQEPPLTWAQPAGWRTYLSMFLTGRSPGEYWNFAFLGRLNVVSAFPLADFGVFGLALAAAGLAFTWRGNRLLAAYGLSLCGLVMLVVLSYQIHNIFNYFIPAYVLLSVWVGCGGHALLSLVQQQANISRRQLVYSGHYLFLPVAALLLLLPVSLVAKNLPRVDRSGDYSAHDFALTTLANVKPDATIVTDSWTASPLWYVQLVEGYRRDVIVSPVFSAHGEDVNAFIAQRFSEGRPVYLAEGLRVDVDTVRSAYSVQPVVLDSIETMVTGVLPKPEYKDDLVPRGSLYRVLEGKPSLTVDEVPAEAQRLVSFDDGVDLVGFQVEPNPGQRGDIIRFVYYWRLRQNTADPLYASMLFADDNGAVDVRHGFPFWWQGWQLGGGIYPTSEWQPGEIIKEEYYMLVPRVVNSGTYHFRMRISGGPLDLSASPSSVAGSDVQVLGEVTVQ